ncbi:hypothetical protein [Actinoallomurus acaciae]|uniref:PH domain-containing protein n=1 Tax=Actinoallomurus acaciae TaxID=502577 RepID=A0ABV5YEC5_9ACTN
MTGGTFWPGSSGPPPATFPVTQLVVSAAEKRRVYVFTLIAVVVVFVLGLVGILTYQEKLGIIGHTSMKLLAWTALPGIVVIVLLVSGIRRFNALRLRRRGNPATLTLSPAGLLIESAVYPLNLPWPQIVYIQPQGSGRCTVPALDPDKRQVLFLDVPADQMAKAVGFHSGGRTTPRVVQVGQTSTGLQNLANAYKRL